MNKYILVAAAVLVLALPVQADAQDDFGDASAADVEAPSTASQDWRQKWAQQRGQAEATAKAKYDALPPEQKQAIQDRIAQARKLKQEKTQDIAETHGKTVADGYEELRRKYGDDASKYSAKAKESFKQLKATQGSDAYHNHQKMNDFKYQHMDEAQAVRRGYRDFARTHPGVDAAADSAKDWWAKRKTAQ